MRLLLAIAFAVASVGFGCDEHDEREFAGQLGHTNRLKFFKHEASGLCFAYFYEKHGSGKSEHGGPALTYVPCENVEKLLGGGGE